MDLGKYLHLLFFKKMLTGKAINSVNQIFLTISLKIAGRSFLEINILMTIKPNIFKGII